MAEEIKMAEEITVPTEEIDNFKIEFPLKLEKFQEDKLSKTFRVANSLYNRLAGISIRKFHELTNTKEYKKLETIKDKKTYFKNHGFSQYGFGSYLPFPRVGGKVKTGDDKIIKAICGYKHFTTCGINSKIMEQMLVNLWSAYEKKILDNRIKVKMKPLHSSYAVSSLSVRVACHVNEKNGQILNSFAGFKVSNDFHYVDFTYDKGGEKVTDKDGNLIKKKPTILRLKLDVKQFTDYELWALKGEIRVIALVRKKIRGKYKYYIQFAIKGEKPQRILGKGKVGIDVGPSSVAVVAMNNGKVSCHMYPLAPEADIDEKKIKLLQRKIDRSRRANNPDCFNEDGTYIRGKKIKPAYQCKNLAKLTSMLQEARRKQSDNRKISHNLLADKILTFGNEFVVEKNEFAGMAKRSTKTEISEKTGKFKKKKRYGKSIGNHAPAMFVTLLENKVKSFGGKFYKVNPNIAATQFDFTTQEFTKHELKDRFIMLGDGTLHQRDLMAAFNLANVKINDDIIVTPKNRKKIEKDINYYDLDRMGVNYRNFSNAESQFVDKVETEKILIPNFR